MSSHRWKPLVATARAGRIRGAGSEYPAGISTPARPRPATPRPSSVTPGSARRWGSTPTAPTTPSMMRSPGCTACLMTPSRHLLVQRAATNRAQVIKRDDVLACGAKGSRTPDLLHASNKSNAPAWASIASTGLTVHGRARECLQVCGRWCLLGCPLVSDHIQPTHPVSVAQQFQPHQNGRSTAPDTTQPASCPPAWALPLHVSQQPQTSLPLK